MIYTRWGNEVELLANCGKHTPDGGSVAGCLVRVRRNMDNVVRYQFLEFLKANGGLPEILREFKKVRKVELLGPELERAIIQAS